MNIRGFSLEVKRTMPELGDNLLNQIHYALGIVTEAGELSDVIKKLLAYKKPVDWINVREEIGDIMWYIMAFCNLNSFDLEEILQQNTNKLRVRYPEKFDEDKAINRDLDNERRILEANPTCKQLSLDIEV